MLSHIEGFYVITFITINHYDKWNNGGMWIYLQFFLQVLNVKFMWFPNLKWVSSTFHVYRWPMDVCNRQVEDLTFLTSFLCIILFEFCFAQMITPLMLARSLVSNNCLRHLLSWSRQIPKFSSPFFLRALSE